MKPAALCRNVATIRDPSIAGARTMRRGALPHSQIHGCIAKRSAPHCAPSSAHFRAVRTIEILVMGNRLYVGNLSFNATTDSLRTAFAAFGEVTDSHIVMDRETGRSRGFGFVTMGTAC